VRLVEKEHCYIIDDFFSPKIISGFTKNSLPGEPAEDIKEALSYLNGDFKIAYLKQIHSSKIHFIKNEGIYTGDGLFTKEDSLALTVRTADCLPIFFQSQSFGVIGIIHMGWRGAKEGILGNVPYQLSSFRIVLGVGLRKCCYEVGEEFLNYHNLADFIEKKENRLYFDSAGFAKEALKKKGLKEENFFDLGLCNLCSKENFFSHRRNKTSLRNISFILKQ
jgi:YfiH family protein